MSNINTGIEKNHFDFVIIRNIKYMKNVFNQTLPMFKSLSLSVIMNRRKNATTPIKWRKYTLFMNRFISQLTIFDKKPNNNHRYNPTIAVLASNILWDTKYYVYYLLILFIDIIYWYYLLILFINNINKIEQYILYIITSSNI